MFFLLVDDESKVMEVYGFFNDMGCGKIVYLVIVIIGKDGVVKVKFYESGYCDCYLNVVLLEVVGEI